VGRIDAGLALYGDLIAETVDFAGRGRAVCDLRGEIVYEGLRNAAGLLGQGV
jgi:hypothetical protein